MDDTNNIVENIIIFQADKQKKREEKEVVHNHSFYLSTKGIFDFFVSLLASVILAVPIGIIALVIVLKDRGNPFYLHKRVGLDGKVIQRTISGIPQKL